MKVTIFTGNQRRHVAMIRYLAEAANEVYAIQECSTVFPGRGGGIIRRSEVMEEYFSHVTSAENETFGPIDFCPPNVRHLAIAYNDVSNLELDWLAESLKADVFIVFGASYIKKPLIDILVEQKAVNIHMGGLPYYRGASCNFWSLYDNNADLVCGSVQRIAPGLDTGDVLFQVAPKPQSVPPLSLGMLATKATLKVLCEKIKTGEILELEPVTQNRDIEIRYTRGDDFTDEVAREFLSRNIQPDDVRDMIAAAPPRELVRVEFFGS